MLHWYLVACWGQAMTLQCCHDQVAVFYFIPAVVFLIFLFSSYDTEVQRLHGLAWCETASRSNDVKQREFNVISSYRLGQATLLPLSKFFEATWNLENSNIEPVCKITGNYRVAEVILSCLSCHIGIPF